jgi:hypothetical protein
MDLDEAVPDATDGDETGESSRAGRKLRSAREHWLEIVSVFILSVASLAAAWSGYQATGWSGEQSQLYSEASDARIESMRLSLVDQQLTLIDLESFYVYVIAVADGNTALADFQVRQFRDEFLPAFEAWLALDPLNKPDAPPSPILMPEYESPEIEEAGRLSEASASLIEQGNEASETSDDYVLATVFLAAVLFFVGISSRLDWLPARVTLIIVGAAMLVFALFELASYPVLRAMARRIIPNSARGSPACRRPR